jgi:hypothetical protein
MRDKAILQTDVVVTAIKVTADKARKSRRERCDVLGDGFDSGVLFWCSTLGEVRCHNIEGEGLRERLDVIARHPCRNDSVLDKDTDAVGDNTWAEDEARSVAASVGGRGSENVVTANSIVRLLTVALLATGFLHGEDVDAVDGHKSEEV